MIVFKCDRCGEVIGQNNCYSNYSYSQGKNVDLCLKCHNEFKEALKKADKKFFKGEK